MSNYDKTWSQINKRESWFNANTLVDGIVILIFYIVLSAFLTLTN